MNEAVTGEGAFEVIVKGLVGETTDAVEQMEENVVKELECVTDDGENSVKSRQILGFILRTPPKDEPAAGPFHQPFRILLIGRATALRI